jgi:hypothetical protein
VEIHADRGGTGAARGDDVPIQTLPVHELSNVHGGAGGAILGGIGQAAGGVGGLMGGIGGLLGGIGQLKVAKAQTNAINAGVAGGGGGAPAGGDPGGGAAPAAAATAAPGMPAPSGGGAGTRILTNVSIS